MNPIHKLQSTSTVNKDMNMVIVKDVKYQMKFYDWSRRIDQYKKKRMNF